MNPVSEIGSFARREPVLFIAFASLPVLAILNFLVFIPMQNAVLMHELDKATDQLKQNLHSYQIALERYATDSESGTYPADFDEVIEKGYLDEYLPNPYYGLTPGAPPKMMPVRPGHFVPGCFVYGCYVLNQDGEIYGYNLFALGWWVDGLPDDKDALIRFAPQLTITDMSELSQYLSSQESTPHS